MKKVAVVVLNWNGASLLKQFLPLLLQRTPDTLADIIVADNGSTDTSLQLLESHFPSVKVIALNRNHGFAKGYNLALQNLNHEYAVLLNSDVEVATGWLNPLVDYLDLHPDTVAAQPKLLSYNNKNYFEYAGAAGGYVDRFGYPFCRGRIQQSVEPDNQQYDDVKPILWASGACLFVRLKDYQEVGGLDEFFFAHQEEIDLCWRLVSQGKEIVYIPSSVVYHVGGATLKKENPGKTFLNFRNNLLLIYKNVSGGRMSWVLFVRFFLDILAAVQFLFRGQASNTWAICRAWSAFLKIRPTYKAIRKEIQTSATCKDPEQIYQGCIIADYYLKGKKTFSQLNFTPESHGCKVKMHQSQS